MRHSARSACSIALILTSGFVAGETVRAQSPPPQAIESMPVRFGPLGLAPSVALTNVGVDSNVFDDPSNPQDDFTATMAPKLTARLRTRKVLFSYTGAVNFVYFQRLSSERSIDSTTGVRADADFGRLQPYIDIGHVHTKERLNAELDARAPRTQWNYAAGTRLLLASRTAVVAGVRRAEINFDPDARFLGVDLSEMLNSRANTADLGLQMTLTPLTTFSLTGSLQEDRFERAPERNADSLRILPTLQFAPDALVRGSVSVGYRRFAPRRSDLPDYNGLVAQAGLGLTFLGRTTFDLSFLRDVQYSFEEFQPYYLSTGGRLTITHQLVGRTDVQVTGGRQTMAYREMGRPGETRRDRAGTVGLGAGYRLRDATRLGINWERDRRRSLLAERQYSRQRLFVSLAFGS